MVKRIKMITLDEELLQHLKEEQNASALINSLLIKHYELMANSQMTIEQKKKKIEKLRAELEFRKKIEAIDNERV